MCPHVGLVAEHGFYTRKPGMLIWERLNDHFDLRDWMDTTVGFVCLYSGFLGIVQLTLVISPCVRAFQVNLMQLYTKRTYGTYVERKDSMVLWQYRDADPEFGSKQVRFLVSCALVSEN